MKNLSTVIAGTWRWKLHPDEIINLIHAAIDNGITAFDHADIYGNYSIEEEFGKALRKQPGLRNKIQLISKCGICLLSDKRPEHRIKHYNTSAVHIIQSAENSLRLLHTDRLDVILIHRPDPLMDVHEVAEAFQQLKQQGKVLAFGVSNFTASQTHVLYAATNGELITNQIELSLLKHDALFDGTVDALVQHNMRAMAWSPLGGGKLLTPDDAKTYRIAEGLSALQAKYNATATQLLLAWLLKHPSGIMPVIGTTNAARIAEAAQAMHITLDRQDWFVMLKLATGHDVA